MRFRFSRRTEIWTISNPNEKAKRLRAFRGLFRFGIKAVQSLRTRQKSFTDFLCL